MREEFWPKKYTPEEVYLALFLFNFVATEVLFGLGEDNVLAQDWIVLAKAELVWRIHRVLLGVVKTNAGFFGNQTNKLALSITFLCHIRAILSHLLAFVNIAKRNKTCSIINTEGGNMLIEATSDNFQSEVLDAKLPVIVDFNATWCPPCQMLRPILEEFAEDHADECKVVSVDIDEAQELAAEFEIATIPCLVLIRNGEEVDRKIGLQSERKLLKWIRK